MRVTLANVVSVYHGQPVTSSTRFANVFERSHKTILRRIRNLTEQNGNFKTCFISRGNYWLINKDGFSMLAYGFGYRKNKALKQAYMEEFNRVESENNATETLNDCMTAELRVYCRRHFPETRGYCNLAHIGSKSEIIEFLSKKGVKASDVRAVVKETYAKTQKEQESEVVSSPCGCPIIRNFTTQNLQGKTQMNTNANTPAPAPKEESSFSEFTVEQLARAIELMVSPDDLRQPEVMAAILKSLSYTPEEVSAQLKSGEKLEDGPMLVWQF